MLRSLLVLLLCLPIRQCLYAQPLATYTDIQNQVMVWDNGMIHKVDFLPPTSIKVGRTCIPYLDNSRTFKVYYGGGVKQLNIGFTNAFFVTDNLVAYLNQKALSVFDKGVTKNLTGVCDQYFVGDSVVLYLDSYKGEYRAYYNGNIYSVEAYFTDSQLSSVKTADNIIAYFNFANQFRIFFHGSKIAQEDFPIVSYEVGRNTVAYVDNDRRFKVFHNNKTFTLDDFPPASFKAGDDLVAFVSSDGYFKIFYADSVRTIGFYNPNYQVNDYIVSFKERGGSFKVFYKGDITELETYLPTNIVAQYNSLAYVNASNTLKLFTEGEVYEVTTADLTAWQLNYDVITYQIGQGIFKVYYKGTEY
jgi:hypothetical protein